MLLYFFYASSWKPHVHADMLYLPVFCAVLLPSCGRVWVVQPLHNSVLLLVQNATVPELTNGTSRAIRFARMPRPIQAGVHAHTHSVMPSAA